MKFTKQIQLLLVGLLLLPAQLSIGQTGWRSFQNGGQSLDNENKLPLKWEPESVVWKATLAGYGQSSPVVYGDSVYVCSVAGTNKDTLNVEAFSVKTGEPQWTFARDNSSPEKNTVMVSRAAPTPVVDGDGLIAFFGGGNLYAIDHQGKRRFTNQSSINFKFKSIKVDHESAK